MDPLGKYLVFVNLKAAYMPTHSRSTKPQVEIRSKIILISTHMYKRRTRSNQCQCIHNMHVSHKNHNIHFLRDSNSEGKPMSQS